MNQQSTIKGAADYELEVRELEGEFTAAMRMLLQLSRRLQEPAAAGFVEQCAQVKTVIADLQRMARDLPDHGSYGEPFGEGRDAMLGQVKAALAALAAASEKLSELRLSAIRYGSTS